MNALQLTLYVGVETLYAGALFTHYLACKITHAKRRVSYYLQFFRKIFPNYFSGLMLGEGMIPYAKEAVEAFEPHLKLEEKTGLLFSSESFEPALERASAVRRFCRLLKIAHKVAKAPTSLTTIGYKYSIEHKKTSR